MNYLGPHDYFRHYARKYNLKAEPILSFDQLTQYSQVLANVRTGLPPSVEEWQSLVSDILLTPKVPEDIARTFHIAKRLFVFSYFEYLFSTVSGHYAFLAVEAGVQARWIANLPNPCRVNFRNGVTNAIHNLSYGQLLDHFHADRRLPGQEKFRVNGERFPSTMDQLLAALEKLRIINSGDERAISVMLDMRNAYSHREFSTVSCASADVLTMAAGLLGKLFDST